MTRDLFACGAPLIAKASALVWLASLRGERGEMC